jgi:hypothetical protein
MYVPKRANYELLNNIVVSFEDGQLWNTEIFSTNLTNRTVFRCQKSDEVMYFNSVELFTGELPFTVSGFHYQFGAVQMKFTEEGEILLEDDAGYYYHGAWSFA